MGKVGIAFPNRVSGATFAAAGWTETLPPSRLATKQIADVARSLSAANDLTRVWISLPEARAVDLLALCGSNLSTAAQFRLLGYSGRVPDWEFASSAGELPAAITPTRGSIATYFGSDGLLKTAAIDEPRFAWSGGAQYLMREEAATNAALHCRDATNAAWVKTSMTVAKTATGIDGAANSASRLTATGANGRITQSIAGSSTARVVSFYLRRVSGTGTVEITMNNFTNTQVVVLTSDWQRFELGGTLSNPNIGVRCVTSGDVIEMDFAQLENGATATSAIETTTTGVGRSADLLKITDPAALGLSLTKGALAITFAQLKRPGGTVCVLGFDDGTANETARITAASSGQVGATVVDGGVAQATFAGGTPALGAFYTASMRFAANDFAASFAGAAASTDVSGTVPTVTAIGIGSGSAGTGVDCLIERIAIWSDVTTDDMLEAFSADLADPAADYTGAWTDAWPAAYLSATNSEAREGLRNSPTFLTGSTQTYQFWRVEIDDDTNTDGYVELGRVFMGSLWQPGINMVYGASLHYEPRDQVSETRSGAEYFDELNGYRVARFRLQAATEGEAVLKLMRMQRQLGTSGELFFVWDDDDTTYAPERTFLGRMRALSPITAARWSEFEAEFDIKELL